MTPRMKSLLSLHGKKVIMGLIFLLVMTTFCYYTAYAATTKTIKFIINGKKEQVSAHSLTVRNVGDFLNQEGITLGQHDTVSPSSDTPLTQGMIIQVKRGIQITLNVGGKTSQIWTFPMTVKELLDNEKVILGSKDKINSEPYANIHEGSHILVTRVTTKKAVVKESVGYKVVNQTDPNLAKGQTRTIRSGINGERKKTYLITYENGKQTNRDLIKTSLTKAPQNKIIAQGTNVSSQTDTTSRSLPSSSRTIEMVGTAYTADCSGCSGTTATGINLRSNPDAKIIAVDPSVIPLGTKVYVEGYGYAVAADTGGGIRGNHIDIYMASQSDAINWGNREVAVRILN